VANFKATIEVGGQSFETLADILPANSGKLKILFIGKTPMQESVDVGHYFQGKHGKFFWNKLANYNILTTKEGTFEDENLLDHKYGITDIVKKPRPYKHMNHHEPNIK
jgi:uracil-DNA glycosylase